MLVVHQRRVFRIQLRRVGREAVAARRLPLVEQRVDADVAERDELDVLQVVDLLHPEDARDPLVALRKRGIRE